VTTAGAWKVAPIVTWYGPGFYGGRTACGQRYTRYIVGVASRTLPCGTLVQFRWRGITVVAPVIDRGPYATPDFVFDWSARLACDLFRERGQKNGCFTRHNVEWRVVGKRR
jgi:rare lipoprotein A (peptidoglycan hydrolase)